MSNRYICANVPTDETPSRGKADYCDKNKKNNTYEQVFEMGTYCSAVHCTWNFWFLPTYSTRE